MPEVTTEELKKLIEDTGNAHKELEHSVKKQLDEMKRNYDDPLLAEKIDKLSKEVAEKSFDKEGFERAQKTLEDRISQMEADLKAKPAESPEDEQKKIAMEKGISMLKYFRSGAVDLDQMDGMDSEGKIIEGKALSRGHDPDGGYLVPPEQTSMIIKKVFETSPMRQVCTVETIGRDRLQILEDINDMAGGWTYEQGSRSETDTAEIGKRDILVHELYAMPKATQQILDDSVMNLESWMSEKQGDKFARLENTAFVTGTGVGQPRGFTTYDAGTTNPGQIERVTTAADDTLDDVDLVSLLYKLKGPYRNNATWAFNRNTLAVIAKIQDGQGRFVFQPGLQLGTPNSLLGRPMVEFNDMADIANGTLPVAIADWKAAYTVVDRKGITVLRDPFTSKGFVLFYTTKRVGGDVTNFEAVKMIVIQ